MAWKQYAFHGYLALQKLDGTVLEPRLPGGALLQPAARRPATRLSAVAGPPLAARRR